MVQHFVSRKNHLGFTLLEMITVLVILSFTTIAGVRIVIALVEGQVLVKKQSQILVDSQLTMDRLGKQLRLALPFSLRESNANRCLSFMPVVASGFYRDALPDSINLLPPSGNTVPLNISPYHVDNGEAIYFSVGAQSSAEIYGSSPVSLEGIHSLSPISVTLSQDHQWQQNAIEQRFFLTDRPQAFCVLNNELRYYHDVSQVNSDIDLNGRYDLLMNNIRTPSRIFTIDDSANGCQHCVTVQLQFEVDDIQQRKHMKVSLFYAR